MKAKRNENHNKMTDWFFSSDFSLEEGMSVPSLQVVDNVLPEESDVGHTEYKRKISKLPPRRFRKLVTQLRFRLREGFGKATYFIGVDDDGKVSDIDDATLRTSMRTFRNMAKMAGAEVAEVTKMKSEDGKSYFQVDVISDRSF